jgi:hypothetical protein
VTAAAGERRRRALRAALTVAREFGVGAEDASVLKDSNNTVIHLAPAPLVAKVATTTIRADAREGLEREVAVATHLAGRGAPVVSPSADPPPGPHRTDAAFVSLWRYYEREAVEDDAGAAGEALRALHDALADYPGDLPDFTAQLDHATALVERMPTISDVDRAFLRRTSRPVRTLLGGRRIDRRPLHGEAHLGNLIRTSRGLLWLDFEAACAGPLEWDLSSLPEGALASFAGVDETLLELLRAARSFCVAAWCLAQPGRAPEVDEAASVQLSFLRGTLREWPAR